MCTVEGIMELSIIKENTQLYTELFSSCIKHNNVKILICEVDSFSKQTFIKPFMSNCLFNLHVYLHSLRTRYIFNGHYT